LSTALSPSLLASYLASYPSSEVVALVALVDIACRAFTDALYLMLVEQLKQVARSPFPLPLFPQ
jgi:hypothetical protein